MKPKLIIKGAAGRMGKRIISLAIEDDYFQIIGAVEYPGQPDCGKDAGVIAAAGPIGVKLSPDLPAAADVLIDFSLPDATDQTVDHCVKNNIALVIGTTGLTGAQIDSIRAASQKIPLIQAANMSVGMNILFELVGKAAQMAGEDYDIEIVEAHHRFKKDSPSGSALTLAENIAKATGRPFPDCLTHGRHGADALREKGKIGMHAIRAGDITGEHSVIYSALGETITISHRAHNRDNFARGALRAAKWVTGKPPAQYKMKDVLGI